MLSQFNLPWYDHNAQRALPLLNDASAVDNTGDFKLPTDVLVGLWLPVYADADLNPAGFFIRVLINDAAGITGIISYESQVSIVDVATFRVSWAEHTRNKSYRVYGLSIYQMLVGVVVVCQYSSLSKQPYGRWEFSPDAGRLDPTCIQLIPRCVESLSVTNNGVTSDPITGQVELVMGSNIQATPITGMGSPRLRLNALSSSGFEEPCICEGDESSAPCVRTINGVASTNGNIDLLGNDCAQIKPIINGLQVENTCCKPCCGCPELETVTRSLQQFESERQLWLNFVQGLGVQVQNASMNFLGAKLGDRGCVQCT